MYYQDQADNDWWITTFSIKSSIIRKKKAAIELREFRFDWAKSDWEYYEAIYDENHEPRNAANVRVAAVH
jgi:hypothetical protein